MIIFIYKEIATNLTSNLEIHSAGIILVRFGINDLLSGGTQCGSCQHQQQKQFPANHNSLIFCLLKLQYEV